jgi:hypothetical protein
MRITTLLSATLLLILTHSTNVYAEAYRCVGLDGEGNKVNVLYDESTETINVNGHVLKIEAATNGKNGMATEDFERDDGTKAYISLVVEGKNKIILRQFQSADDKELAIVPLACE